MKQEILAFALLFICCGLPIIILAVLPFVSFLAPSAGIILLAVIVLIALLFVLLRRGTRHERRKEDNS